MSCSELPLSEWMTCVTVWKKLGCGQGQRGEFPLCHNLCSQEFWPLLTPSETLASHCVATRKSKSDTYLLWEQTRARLSTRTLPIPLQDDMWENYSHALPETYNHCGLRSGHFIPWAWVCVTAIGSKMHTLPKRALLQPLTTSLSQREPGNICLCCKFLLSEQRRLE